MTVEAPARYTAAVLHGEQTLRVEQRVARPIGLGQLRLRLAFAGVCGTDIHYWRGFSNAGFRLQSPVVLGHEATGIVVETGAGVTGFAPGDKVVVDPVMACGDCASCRRGRRNLCERKRYPGSATTVPHIDGYFRDLFEAEAACCIKVPPDADLSHLALTEPLACSLHGVEQAGPVTGRRVLVTGAGPIGTLAAAAARAAGAGWTTLTDITDEPLAIGRRMGADEIVNTVRTPISEVIERDGPFDVAIEASGAPPALGDCIAAVRRGGIVVQLGIMPGAVPIAANLVMLREIELRGSSQYTEEFGRALELIRSGRIDVAPMITHRFDVAQVDVALGIAADRQVSMKVQIVGAAA